MTASSSGSIPRLRYADPHSTTTPVPERVRSRSADASVSAETVDRAQNSSSATGWSSATVSSSSRMSSPRLFQKGIGHQALRKGVAAVAPDVRTHPDQIDHSAELGLVSHRQLDHERGHVQPLADRVRRCVEVGAGAVHLVDERDPRHSVPVGLAPDRLALRFDSRDGVEQCDGTVEYPQRALHLVGEIDVARGVDQVDRVPVPVAADGRGEDRDPTIAFLRVEVGDGRAVVDLTALVSGAGEIQNPFGDGGLAGIDMGEDADIAQAGQRAVLLTVVKVCTHGRWPFG